MTIIRLQEAGEEITLDLVGAEIVQGNFGEQVKFDSNTGDTLYVPLNSVVRQLDRCGVAEVSELSGRTIHFSRAANSKPGAKPYWNLDKAREGDVVKKNGNGKPAAKQVSDYETPIKLPGEDEAFDNIINRYGECLVTAQREIVPTLKKGGYEVTTADLLAATATIFIERNKKNV